MNLKKYSWYFTIIILAALPACNGINYVDGGTCKYENKIYPAVVIKIDKKDSLNADILFRINDETGNLYRDSVSWNMEKKEYALLSMIKKDSIRMGNRYRYVVKQITEGSCVPKIEILILEKYK